MVFKLALIQMRVTPSKSANLDTATDKIAEACRNGADVVVLPECFNSPYGVENFPKYAETVPGRSSETLSRAARENGVYLIGGTIPAKKNGKIYNMCLIFNPKGELIASFSKLHLADLNIKEEGIFRESDTVTPGSQFTAFDTPFCKIGIGICYDLRFAEVARIYGKIGCKLIVYPGEFTVITGSATLEPLLRARALDNQLYTAFCSTARNNETSYTAWGHSSAISPWGEVLATSDENETVVYSNIDPEFLDEVRSELPILTEKRFDLYTDVNLRKSKHNSVRNSSACTIL